MQKRRKIFVLGRGSSRTTHINWLRAFYWSTRSSKGFVNGNAGVSPLHTLSIINVENARASEIAELSRDMQNSVEKLFGIKLEREVEYVGDII